MERDYRVFYNKQLVYSLNGYLAERQCITDEQLEALKRLHRKKQSLFALARLTDNKTELRQIAADFEKVEFEMQDNWNFPMTKSFHEWYLVPKCKCPLTDNAQRRGATDSRIIVENCPIHGKRFRGE
jgi:hypothetical protein